jgi:nucleoside-diphosphate-sugar epimerase
LPVDVDMEIPDGPESQATMYRISKILAHQATRDFLAQQKPAFKLLTTHPVFVVGENRFQSSAEQIDFVNGMLFTALKVEKPFFPSLWVDVKDVAAAHVRALESSTPTGTEFLLCCPGVSWDDVVTFVKKNYPEVECNLQPPFGPSGTVETGSAEKYLDMQWTAYEKTFRQVFEQQLSFKNKPSE